MENYSTLSSSPGWRFPKTQSHKDTQTHSFKTETMFKLKLKITQWKLLFLQNKTAFLFSSSNNISVFVVVVFFLFTWCSSFTYQSQLLMPKHEDDRVARSKRTRAKEVDPVDYSKHTRIRGKEGGGMVFLVTKIDEYHSRPRKYPDKNRVDFPVTVHRYSPVEHTRRTMYIKWTH